MIEIYDSTAVNSEAEWNNRTWIANLKSKRQTQHGFLKSCHNNACRYALLKYGKPGARPAPRPPMDLKARQQRIEDMKRMYREATATKCEGIRS